MANANLHTHNLLADHGSLGCTCTPALADYDVLNALPVPVLLLEGNKSAVQRRGLVLGDVV